MRLGIIISIAVQTIYASFECALENFTKNIDTPTVLWLTGLSGAGKSTIAIGVQEQLLAAGNKVCILDGDELRRGLCSDLGFTDADRVENIRRAAEVARMMVNSGTTVIVALISPFRTDRMLAAKRIGQSRFLEIHINTPLEVAEQRDVKGLYQKARAGQLKNFTGIDSPYEVPESPALTITTTDESAEQSVERVLLLLRHSKV